MSDFHLAGVVRDHADRHGDAAAVTCGDTTLTYRELDALSDRVAAHLRSLGAGQGARIAHLDRNALESPVLLFAAAKLGAVLVPLNWRLAKAELETVVEDSGADILVVGPDFEDVGEGLVEHVLKAADLHELDDAGDFDDEPADRDEPVLQLYTSGTTGKPKGVLLSNANMDGLAEEVAEFWGIDDSSVSLVAMPLFHIGGIGWMAVGLTCAAENVIIPEIDPEALLETMESQGVTNAFLVPTVLQMLCGVDGAADRDWSALRSIAYGASPITTKALKAVLKTFEAPLYQVYGLTETTGAIVQLPAEDHDNEDLLQSAGKPYPWIELKIVDSDGDEVDAGDVGEVWVRGQSITAGYHNREEATREALTDDGWFKTGDGGYVDDGGYLFLTDRVKDMIVSGGENVYPVEVEDVLSQHEDVDEVAVIGLPDDDWGEVVTAVVVTGGDAELELDPLKEFAREKLAGYKLPRRLYVVDELPKTATGKVLKKDLREQYAEPD